MAILDFLKPQLVDATAPGKKFSNKTSCTFLESSTKTLLKEVKHVVSVKHEYWNWDEPRKVILLVRKVEFSNLRGKYPKGRIFEKMPSTYWERSIEIWMEQFEPIFPEKQESKNEISHFWQPFLKIFNHDDFAASVKKNDVQISSSISVELWFETWMKAIKFVVTDNYAFENQVTAESWRFF